MTLKPGASLVLTNPYLRVTVRRRNEKRHSMLRSVPVRLFLPFLLWLLGSLGPLSAAPPEAYRFLSLTDAARQASSEGKPMFLYFGRYGCSTCRKMHAEVFSDAALTERMNAGFVLAYVDTESGNRIRLGSGEVITEIEAYANADNCSDKDETLALLEWLYDDKFTFLGYREYDWNNDLENPELTIAADQGLGLMRQDAVTIGKKAKREAR